MCRWHAAKGISDEVSIATLSDVGVNLSHYHRTFGRWGLDEPARLGHHLAGQIFQLSRLQFQLGRWWVPPAEGVDCPLAVDEDRNLLARVQSFEVLGRRERSGVSSRRYEGGDLLVRDSSSSSIHIVRDARVLGDP